MNTRVWLSSLLLLACGPAVPDASSTAEAGQSAGSQGPSPTGTDTGSGDTTTTGDSPSGTSSDNPGMRFDVGLSKLDVNNNPPTPPLGCCGAELPPCSDGFDCVYGFCVSMCWTKGACPTLAEEELTGECRPQPGEINPPPPQCVYPCSDGSCPNGFVCNTDDLCVVEACEA